MKTARAAILLETIVSVAIFIAAGITLIGVLMQSDAIAGRSKQEQIASDLCRSAMAQLSAGIARPESLNGPVRPLDTSGQGFDDTPPETNWELRVTTEPAQFQGLTKVTIDAMRVQADGKRRPVASLCQLVPAGDLATGAGGRP